jgi:hypothetical protein
MQLAAHRLGVALQHTRRPAHPTNPNSVASTITAHVDLSKKAIAAMTKHTTAVFMVPGALAYALDATLVGASASSSQREQGIVVSTIVIPPAMFDPARLDASKDCLTAWRGALGSPKSTRLAWSSSRMDCGVPTTSVSERPVCSTSLLPPR